MAKRNFYRNNYIQDVEKFGLNYPEKIFREGARQDLGSCAPMAPTENRHGFCRAKNSSSEIVCVSMLKTICRPRLFHALEFPLITNSDNFM